MYELGGRPGEGDILPFHLYFYYYYYQLVLYDGNTTT